MRNYRIEIEAQAEAGDIPGLSALRAIEDLEVSHFGNWIKVLARRKPGTDAIEALEPLVLALRTSGCRIERVTVLDYPL